MTQIIISSKVLKHRLKLYKDWHKTNIKLSNGILSFNLGHHLEVEHKGNDFNDDYSQGQIKTLYSILKLTSDQPITLAFDDSWIYIKDFIISG